MKMFFRLLMSFFFLQSFGCGLIADKKEPAYFYNSIAGWDIRHVPIIKPFRVSSIDGGRSWLLNKEELGSIEVSQFGVTQNFIYGQSNTKWFVFDTKSKLYAVYKTELEMNDCLKSFKIKTGEILECNDYFKRLTKGIKPYWFPEEGNEYPDYPPIIARDIIDIKITDSGSGDPDFKLLKQPKVNKEKIYFFRVLYSKGQNDLYYLSFNSQPPIQVKDSLLITVFETSNMFDITMYTPYPIAEKRGIPESKRLHTGHRIFF